MADVKYGQNCIVYVVTGRTRIVDRQQSPFVLRQVCEKCLRTFSAASTPLLSDPSTLGTEGGGKGTHAHPGVLEALEGIADGTPETANAEEGANPFRTGKHNAYGQGIADLRHAIRTAMPQSVVSKALPGNVKIEQSCIVGCLYCPV